MNTTKKITSLVLAVMMVVSMLVVGAVSVSALDETDADIELTRANGTVSYINWGTSLNSADGTYKLLRDVTRTMRTSYGTWVDDMTIDLNGHTLTCTANDYVLGMRSNDKLTIKSSVAGGKIIAENLNQSDNSQCVIFCSKSTKNNVITIEKNVTIQSNACVINLGGDNHTVNIKGGTFNVTDDFVIATNGSTTTNCSINVSGGTLTTTGEAGIYQPAGSTELNISGGTITGKTGVYVKSGTANISGGTIKGVGDAAEYTYDGSGVNATGDALVIDNCGYPGGAPVVNITGGTYTTTNASSIGTYAHGDREPVAPSINADVEFTNVAGTQLAYMKASTSMLSSNGTYKLLKDISLKLRLAPGILYSDIVFDLNGHTFTSAAPDYAILLSRAGSATAPKSFVLKNGTLNAATCGVAAIANYTNVLIDNCTINAGDDFAVVTNGTKVNDNITIKDSTITSKSVAVYFPSTETLTIDNSSITGANGVYVKCGTLSINEGSVIKGTGAKADFVHNGNGVNLTGDGLVVEACDYPGGYPTVNVTGGTFISLYNKGIAAYAQREQDEATAASFDFSAATVIDNTLYEDADETTFVVAQEDGTVVEKTLEEVKTETKDFDELTEEIKEQQNALSLPDKEYNTIDLVGFQQKIAHGEAVQDAEEGTTEGGNDINTVGVRFVTVVNEGLLKGANIAEYGYVLARFDSDVDPVPEKIYNMLTVDGGNGQKVIDCTGSSNTLCGDAGLYAERTTEKVVTCAVNGIPSGARVIARFYVKTKDGNVIYSEGKVATAV